MSQPSSPSNGDATEEIPWKSWAGFALGEQGWDVFEKFISHRTWLLVRRDGACGTLYREVLVEPFRLRAAADPLFDATAKHHVWTDEFKELADQPDTYVLVVLAGMPSVKLEFLVFSCAEYAQLLACAPIAIGHGPAYRDVAFSRIKDSPDRWVMHRAPDFSTVDAATVVDVSQHAHAFGKLR